MKKLSFLIVFFFTCQIFLSAQFGFSVAYKPIDAPNWEKIIVKHKVYNLSGYTISPLSDGIHFGVDYWFRLKKYRVEFFPEANINRFTKIWLREGKNDLLRTQFVGLHFNTNFYLFNMKGDCDCPTFSKDGANLSKGFFIQLAPGINYVANSFKEDEITKKASDIAPSFGIGVGVDIGLSDFLTITPMVKLQRYFDVEWEGLNEYFPTDQPVSPTLNKGSIDQIFAGIRIGFRFDEMNSRF